VAQMMNLAPAVPAASRNMARPPAIPNGSTPSVKTRMCNKYNTAKGCKFGDKCHFAHNEWQLGKPIAPSHEDQHAMGPMLGRMGARMEPPP
jgi:hypothetical protein